MGSEGEGPGDVCSAQALKAMKDTMEWRKRMFHSALFPQALGSQSHRKPGHFCLTLPGLLHALLSGLHERSTVP